MIPDAMEIYK